MANVGVYPLLPNTEVGAFRVSVGDTESVPLVPPVAGFQGYTYFSDLELESILDSVGNGNSGMAAAYRKLAAILALKAASIQTDDLRVSTEQRAETMRKIAADFDSAADNAAGSTDIFMLAGGVPGSRCAELAEHPWGCGCGFAIV